MIEETTPITEVSQAVALEVQAYLKKLGYYQDGQLDGVPGHKTLNAWKKWKEDNWLNKPEQIGAASFTELQHQAANEINWNNPNYKISDYFSVREVTQGDSNRVPETKNLRNNVVELANKLDEVREQWGSPILVTSWYRPPHVNRMVGGVKNSQHLYGRAADIKPANGKVAEFADWLDQGLWSDKAMHYYPVKRFVHVDLRKGRIRW